MKIKALIICCVALQMAGCVYSDPKVGNKGKKSSSITALITGDPIDFYSDTMLVFPVGGLHYEQPPINVYREEEKEVKSSKNGKVVFFGANDVANRFYSESTKEYRIVDEENQEVKNLIFYNKYTKEKYLLADSGLTILSFAVHKEFKKHLIFYEIVKKDNNKDSLKNSKDGRILFISNTDGTGLTQLSPDDEMYLDYFFYPETNTMLVKSLIDTNKDKTFFEGEETRFTEIDLNNPKMGADIFTDEFKNKLKNMALGGN